MFSLISLNSTLGLKFEEHATKIALVSTIIALLAGSLVYSLMGGPEGFLPTNLTAGYIVSVLALLFLIDTTRYVLLYYEKRKISAHQSRASVGQSSSIEVRKFGSGSAITNTSSTSAASHSEKAHNAMSSSISNSIPVTSIASSEPKATNGAHNLAISSITSRATAESSSASSEPKATSGAHNLMISSITSRVTAESLSTSSEPRATRGAHNLTISSITSRATAESSSSSSSTSPSPIEIANGRLELIDNIDCMTTELEILEKGRLRFASLTSVSRQSRTYQYIENYDLLTAYSQGVRRVIVANEHFKITITEEYSDGKRKKMFALEKDAYTLMLKEERLLSERDILTKINNLPLNFRSTYLAVSPEGIFVAVGITDEESSPRIECFLAFPDDAIPKRLTTSFDWNIEGYYRNGDWVKRWTIHSHYDPTPNTCSIWAREDDFQRHFLINGLPVTPIDKNFARDTIRAMNADAMPSMIPDITNVVSTYLFPHLSFEPTI